MRGQFVQINMASKMSLQTKGNGGYKHEPFTSISYSIAIMVWCRDPLRLLSMSTPSQNEEMDKKWRVAASHHLPLLPKIHTLRGGFSRGCPESERKSTVPPRTPCHPPVEPSTPAWGSLNFTGASPYISHRPQDRAAHKRAPRAPPDRRVTGESRVRAGQ